MAFHRAHRKFGRRKNQRKALLKSLARSLALKGRIQTTEAKAKELRPFIEKLVTFGKKGDMASERLLVSRVGEKAGEKIAKERANKYKDRAGGYTRITKLVRRAADGAPRAVIEFV